MKLRTDSLHEPVAHHILILQTVSREEVSNRTTNSPADVNRKTGACVFMSVTSDLLYLAVVLLHTLHFDQVSTGLWSVLTRCDRICALRLVDRWGAGGWGIMQVHLHLLLLQGERLDLRGVRRLHFLCVCRDRATQKHHIDKQQCEALSHL